jgi:hypothetical protein
MLVALEEVIINILIRQLRFKRKQRETNNFEPWVHGVDLEVSIPKGV